MNLNLWLDLIILTLVWAGLGGAWNILAGYAGQFSLGHSAFFGVGAYTSSLIAMRFGVSPWLGMIAGAALAALLALVVAGVSLRTRGPFFTLMTIAFAEVVRILAVYGKAVTNGSEGLIIDLPPGLANLTYLDKWPYLAVSAAYAIAVFAICISLHRSRFGYRLLAVREDEDAARSLGVPAYRARVQATALSAALTAIGGSVFAQYTQFIDPDSTMSFLLSVQPALIAIVGGLGQALGPLFGALLVVPLEHFLRSWFGGMLFGLHGFIFGVALIVILLTMPEGLLRVVRDAFRRRRFADA
jgi:branched-chain amino acid transport system permease protein